MPESFSAHELYEEAVKFNVGKAVPAWSDPQDLIVLLGEKDSKPICLNEKRGVTYVSRVEYKGLTFQSSRLEPFRGFDRYITL